MAEFTYSVTRKDGSGATFDEPFLTLDVHRVDGKHLKHVATYYLRWPLHGMNGAPSMSIATLHFDQDEAHGVTDLMLMALTLNEVSDAFTAEHETYCEIFSGDDDDQEIELRFTVHNNA